MAQLHSSALVDLIIDISWQKAGVGHLDRFYAAGLNCWRDIFPGSVLEHLFQNESNDCLTLDIKPGELVPAADHHKTMPLAWSRVNHRHQNRLGRGRFYPKGWLSGLPGIFSANIQPFRCLKVTPSGIVADLNHPMAQIPFTLHLKIQNRFSRPEERGGSCMDWLDAALAGPGMQARCKTGPGDFFTPDAFERENEDGDSKFYATDRFVHHIDKTASQHLSEIYRTLVLPGANVLDLMAGWESHLPSDLELSSVHGIGLNGNELGTNPLFSSWTLQDLNDDPILDFKDHSFNAVLCSLSVEYLTNPISVFREVARVLKPGGVFAVGFSNRWFPEKAIGIWKDLHDFERMGMIAEYFHQSGSFESVSTRSVRGYPRPEDDRHFPKIRMSDPVYVVAGHTR